MFLAPLLELVVGAFVAYCIWYHLRMTHKVGKILNVLNPPAKLSYINSTGDEIELEVNVLEYDFNHLTAKFEVIRPSKGPDYLFEHFQTHPEMYFNPDAEVGKK